MWCYGSDRKKKKKKIVKSSLKQEYVDTANVDRIFSPEDIEKEKKQ